MKKLTLILIGILVFMGLAFAENAIKPEPENPLIKNLRVTRSWAPTGSCISTLDAKWIEPESYPSAGWMIDDGTLQVLLIGRRDAIWNSISGSRLYGQSANFTKSEIYNHCRINNFYGYFFGLKNTLILLP